MKQLIILVLITLAGCAAKSSNGKKDTKPGNKVTILHQTGRCIYGFIVEAPSGMRLYFCECSSGNCQIRE